MRPRGDSYISRELEHRASRLELQVIDEEEPFIDDEWSTAAARRLKRLAHGFEYAMIELDDTDYKCHQEIIAAGEQLGRRTYSSFDVHPGMRSHDWEPVRIRSQSFQ